MLLKEEASNFYYKILKMEFFSSHMLKNFGSHLTWELSWAQNSVRITLEASWTGGLYHFPDLTKYVPL